jgi:hypothetical protein
LLVGYCKRPQRDLVKPEVVFSVEPLAEARVRLCDSEIP